MIIFEHPLRPDGTQGSIPINYPLRPAKVGVLGVRPPVGTPSPQIIQAIVTEITNTSIEYQLSAAPLEYGYTLSLLIEP